MRDLLPLALALAAGTACLGAPPARVRTSPTPAPAPLSLVQPTGLAVGPDGSVFITDIGTHRVLKLDLTGTLTLVAGAAGFNGDGIPAAKARLSAPHDVVLDRDGTLLIADTYNHRIRRVDRKGILTTVAGNGRGVYAGNGGPAPKASLNNPQGLAVGPDGSLYIADTFNHVVRRVDPRGIISTFAGTEAGLAGDGGPAVKAQISLPMAVAAAPDGSVYISDAGNNRIRRVKPDGTIETVLGSGPGSGTAGAGFGGDGGPAVKGRIFAAADVEVTPSGDLLVSDSGNHRIRKVSNGIVTTFAGTGAPDFSGDGGKAVEAALSVPQKIALGPRGSLYIADRGNVRLRRIDAEGRIESITARPARVAAPAE